MAAKVNFTIEGKRGAVTLQAFLEAFKNQLTILRDVDAALSGKPQGVLQWYITDLSLGSFSIGAEARVESEADAEEFPRTYPGEVVRTYRNGLKVIEGAGNSPEYFTDRSLRAAQKSFQLIGRQGVSGYRLTGSDKRAKPLHISARSAVNIEELIRPGVTVYGSVEGRLNVISVAGAKWKFVVFTAISKKGVACYFPEDKLEEVMSTLRRRVIVSGTLTYNRRGEPQKIHNASWRVLRERNELPTTDEMFGAFPDLTGDQTTDEFLAEVRGE